MALGGVVRIATPNARTPPYFPAENLAVNPVYHKRSKHIEIKYHWVREHVDPDGEFGTTRLIHVQPGDQTVDIFTKALTGVIF